MANEPSAMVSAYPDPPNFYTHFTKENEAALRRHRAGLQLPAGAPVPPDSLPADSPLQYLVPPPLPETGSYWSFAEHWQFPERHPRLEDFGIQRLFSDDESVSGPKRVIELRRMSKSLLLSFLELVGVMAINPGEVRSLTPPPPPPLT